ncbi:hypothetical protein BOO92_19925 [Vibrio navarrensis]|uniref:glycosyltransferase n=1 Tax=Vibrio navarrensis TaxID=29495 RepID=UPI00186754B4|nr:glycosyltransferase [Vibrio navarrensis]MBE3658941.1 hypothetical protein [Vibrio navarrensis]
MKVAVNTTNIHAGGALQVAISFLYELTLIKDTDVSIVDVYVSTEIDEGLKRLNVDTSVFKTYSTYDTHGILALFSPLNKVLRGFDVIYTLFGPNYLFTKARVNIVGFAQMWMLDFSNPISERMPTLKRCLLWFKYYIQWRFFERADFYIVELEHVKNKLMSVKKVNSSKIFIVHNTISSIYDNPKFWQPVNINKEDGVITLGLPSRDYPHKNLDIMPLVSIKLKAKYDFEVRFAVTLNELEWSTKSEIFKTYVVNVGELTPEQCPSFYQKLDGVFFPSLLECFSATPLEAMAMGKPIFASDRDFVRDVCMSHACYFDPTDIDNVADVIFYHYSQNDFGDSALSEASSHAHNFSSARNRAEKYLSIMLSNI